MPLLKTCLQYIKMNYNFLRKATEILDVVCSDQICHKLVARV